jgi:two-component system, OmpR family, sensor histidine kinase QseC
MKRFLRFVLRPSLVRRVTVVMLLAFVLVWVVLMANLYYKINTRDINDGRRQQWAAELLEIIDRYETDAEVRVAAEVISDRTNNPYRRSSSIGPFLMQVTHHDDRLLYLTAQAKGQGLGAGPALIENRQVGDKPYRVYRISSARWKLAIAEPVANVWWLLAIMSEDLTIYVILASIIVLVPLWFAVSRGLRPLNRVSSTIAARGPDSLQPLVVDTRYAELAPLTDSLNSLLAQLRAKMEREHAFVADAAHELRTPMAVIAAQAHVLVKADGPQQRGEAEQKLELAIGRASHLIGQLLAMAHVDSDDQRAGGMMDVADLVRNELALMAPAALARKLDLSLEAPDVLMHPIEAHAFRSILQNLAINAIRYVQEGGQVAVDLRIRNGALILTVADNGPGIPQAQRDLVFERFYRGASSDAVQGSGLGLAIVRQACARLRGSVSLAAGKDGRGCTFKVKIPAMPVG